LSALFGKRYTLLIVKETNSRPPTTEAIEHST